MKVAKIWLKTHDQAIGFEERVSVVFFSDATYVETKKAWKIDLFSQWNIVRDPVVSYKYFLWAM